MGRPRGSRNADYDQKRRKLARKVVGHLIAAPSEHLSLRELARAAGVSVSTMRHYFGDRDGILEASIAEMGLMVGKQLQAAEDGARKATDAKARVQVVLRSLVDAWTKDQLGRAWAVGLAEGAYARPGAATVKHLLDPLLDSLARAMSGADGCPRTASLMLISPLLVALTHQEALGGKDGSPIDVEGLIVEVSERFLRSWKLEVVAA